MIKDLVISAKKGNKYIGNCFYEGGRKTKLALIITRDIIKNFNAHLSNEKDMLAGEFFALRLFQEQNREGTIDKTCPEIASDSNSFLNSVYVGYNLKQRTDKKLGTIAITKHDMGENHTNIEAHIIIDFDEKKIEVNGLYKIYDEDEYKKEKGLDFFGISPSLNKLEIYPYSFDFMDLEDFIDFVELNPDGWRTDCFIDDVMVPVNYV